MQSSQGEGEVGATFFTRRELPPPAERRADAVYDRLREFADGGYIDDVDRSEWKKRSPVGDCECDLRDRYLAFTEWANEQGVRLTPFFDTRQCFSDEEGEMVDWLVMPAFCLVIYTDDGLCAVYPHTDTEDTRTVEDGLQALGRAVLDNAEPTAVMAN